MDVESVKIILELKKLDFSSFLDLEICPHPAYFVFGEKFEKARPRQRGYIHGLSKKLDIDDNVELPYIVGDVRRLTVGQAVEVIEILKELVDRQKEEEDIPLF